MSTFKAMSDCHGENKLIQWDDNDTHLIVLDQHD